MEIIIQPSAQEVGIIAARMVAQIIRKKPYAVLGLPTGSTPLVMYKELIRMHREEKLDFSEVITFNLDEYVGISPEHPCSYNYYMYTNFFSSVNIKPHNINIPDGRARDIPKFCTEFERRIVEAGRIDLQILGIGADGHIGFNEPTSSLASRTRIKTLMPQTRQDNARFFPSLDEVPQHSLTMGIGTIMEAKQCLLMAAGEKKAEAIAKTVEGPITAIVPASALQFHQHTTVLIDEAAAGKLARREYYTKTFDEKPDWQHL
ncbi:MAG: glucosamine-6-phosphate deaminase [Deltaproteobacteria bacterium]|nr:glucosamine-6-phosphate deaminase [Deltaproteobacteria bacterium]